MGLAGLEEPRAGQGVLCVPEARWLRWSGEMLEIGDDSGTLHRVPVRPEELTWVGSSFARIRERPGDGRRLAVAARFVDGATVLIERRDSRTAVAASPKPRPPDAG